MSMNIPGPSSHRCGTTTRARENQNPLPRTFLRARGGHGDGPTTTSTEDDMLPRRERKKRRHTPTHTAGLTEIDVGKPLPRPPSKLRQAATSRAEASSQAPTLLNVRPAKALSGRSHNKRAAVLPAVTFVTESDEEGSESTLGSGELAKLQAQVLELKKQLKDKEKQADDHAKHATKYKREVQNLHKSSKEQRAELDKLKVQHQRNIVSDVEQSLQCQICIDTLTRPYALSPCGHVLCLVCLRDWFRQAPISPEDMDTDNEEPPSLIYRAKSCPVCRTKVRERPLQLYMLKAVVEAVEKARAGPGEKRASLPPEMDDPWEGIFPARNEDVESNVELDTSSDDSEEEVSDEDEDDDSSMDEASDDEDGGLLDVYDNSSDDDYEGQWIHPTWSPPSITRPTRLHPEPFFDSLLRRGATLAMIEKFDMNYTHSEGLSVQDGDVRVYLGWNVSLDEGDVDGSRLVVWCFEDMDARPERWLFEGGGGVAVRLARSDGERYEEGDSEEWVEEDEDDDGEEDDEDEEMD